MAIPILNHMDFGKVAEIQNVLLHTTGSGDVTSPGTGQIIYDSGTIKFYNGSAWLSLASGGGTRTVQIDTNGDGSVNNTLETSENLVLKKGSGVTLTEAGGVVTISANSTLTQEQVEDFVGGMLDGTETGISVSYDDANGNLDFVIGAGDIVHSMLADDAVDADNLASDAVVTASIVDANVTTAKIADASITMAKLANIATDTFIGRTADNAGVPKALSKAEALAILNVADGAQANVSGDSGNAAIYDNSGTPAFKSGITKAEVHTLLNIEDGATADQTAAEIRTLVGTGNSNFVPAAGSAGEFLKHDGTFGTPSYISNSDIDVNIANLTARLPQITESVTIGDATDVVVTTSGNLVVTGDLTVSGDTVTANVGTLDVEDKNITLNKSTSDSSATADGAGLTIQDAVNASTDATMLWNAANDKFVFSHPVDVTGILTATGTSVFANLDISGDVDVDGTLEADAITLNGTALGALATLDTVAAGQIDSNAVTTAKINADAVDGTKIADDAIDSEHITDGSVDNAHLAGSIANAKLSNSSITIDGNAISLGGSVTTNNSQLAIASVAEVQTGTNNTKAITPLRLAQAKNVVQVIDVSSLHATQLNAVIQHDLGTKALQVTAQYKGAAADYQQVIIDWSTNSDTSGTDSDNHILVQFAAVPAYDVTVQIHSKEAAATATGITYPTS
jgi:hypothetical protein